MAVDDGARTLLAFSGAPLALPPRLPAAAVGGRDKLRWGTGQRAPAGSRRRRSTGTAIVALAPAPAGGNGGSAADAARSADTSLLMPDHLCREPPLQSACSPGGRVDGGHWGWFESTTASYALPSAAAAADASPLTTTKMATTPESTPSPTAARQEGAVDVAALGDRSPELDALELQALSVVGAPTSVCTPHAPWDITANAHGVSFFGRRLDYERRRREILAKAYKECERITALHAKTFYLGTSFLSPAKRQAVWAVYTWCRRTDDLVDGPRVVQRSSSLRDVLAGWRTRLDAIFAAGRGPREGEEVVPPRDALDLALVDVVHRYPGMDITPFADMIDGMIMDVELDRFATWKDLHMYCYRVAGTVGLMTLPIMGSADGTQAGLRAAAEPALALGVALQLTNILRDVGEDRLRGRIYLPLEDLERFGYTEEDLLAGVLDDRYRSLMASQIARARAYFADAEAGIALLSEDARLPVRASLDMYAGILDVLEANGYDNFTRRAYVSRWGKLATLPVSWARLQPPSSLPWRALDAYQRLLSVGSG
ncbi:hypothetical protein MMPV_000367 [Pyropia vietnamensis]